MSVEGLISLGKTSIGVLNLASNLIKASHSKINGIPIIFQVWQVKHSNSSSSKPAVDGKTITDNVIRTPQRIDAVGLIGDFIGLEFTGASGLGLGNNTGDKIVNTWQGKVELLKQYLNEVKIKQKFLDIDYFNFTPQSNSKYLLADFSTEEMVATNAVKVVLSIKEIIIVGAKSIAISQSIKAKNQEQLAKTIPQAQSNKSTLSSSLFSFLKG